AAPAARLVLPERVHALSTRGRLLVAACADRGLSVVHLDEPARVFRACQSPLARQTRVVTCFPNGLGWALASVDGRCAVQHVDEARAAANFAFKCHRALDQQQHQQQQQLPPQPRNAYVYSVNDITYHPLHGTFSTAGSDGTFHFWDGAAKHRLKAFPAVGGPITATDFDRSGSIFAYAVSYDWSMGFAANSRHFPNRVMLHPVAPDEVTPRAITGASR
ncbi:hypothetical protein KEM52_004136, partial [Ascosphaera acerosa]